MSCGNFNYVNADSLDDDLQCAICLQPLVDPVNTPCDHIFCESCLVGVCTNDGRGAHRAVRRLTLPRAAP